MKTGLKVAGNLFLYLVCAVSAAIILVTLISVLFIHWTPSFGISQKELISDYTKLIKYLLLAPDNHLSFAYLVMSNNGLRHFADVRHLMLINEGAFILSWGNLLLTQRKLKKRNQLLSLISLLDYLCLLIIILGVLAFVNFNTAFIGFHHLLFAENNWVFNSQTDPIIIAMPVNFFLRLFVIGLIIIILTLQSLKFRLKRLLMSGKFCS